MTIPIRLPKDFQPNWDVWESAYLRFSTPEQERRKFHRRYRQLGVTEWPRDLEILEIFAGRGNGLVALSELGFTRLDGADLSPRLAAAYQGPHTIHVCDCRSLPLPDSSRDAVVVQGGLHHLINLPDDLNHTLAEVRRVLRPGGRFLAVEPWHTPFLGFVHFIAFTPFRKAWKKLDALATMIEHEAETYFNWLSRPVEILDLIDRFFVSEKTIIQSVKLLYLGLRK